MHSKYIDNVINMLEYSLKWILHRELPIDKMVQIIFQFSNINK